MSANRIGMNLVCALIWGLGVGGYADGWRGAALCFAGWMVGMWIYQSYLGSRA